MDYEALYSKEALQRAKYGKWSKSLNHMAQSLPMPYLPVGPSIMLLGFLSTPSDEPLAEFVMSLYCPSYAREVHRKEWLKIYQRFCRKAQKASGKKAAATVEAFMLSLELFEGRLQV